LEPHLTVVLKKPVNAGDKADCILPSVMTCQNYVKMPEYSSYEVLRAKFNVAIEEGASHFSLS
jgi:E3 ubiquitin-protein ligase TRIP12